jgi:hypothetical protein
MDLNTLIETQMSARGLTKSGLSAALRESGVFVSRQAVSAWANGRGLPHAECWHVLAPLLGCTPEDMALARYGLLSDERAQALSAEQGTGVR